MFRITENIFGGTYFCFEVCFSPRKINTNYLVVKLNSVNIFRFDWIENCLLHPLQNPIGLNVTGYHIGKFPRYGYSKLRLLNLLVGNKLAFQIPPQEYKVSFDRPDECRFLHWVQIDEMIGTENPNFLLCPLVREKDCLAL